MSSHNSMRLLTKTPGRYVWRGRARRGRRNQNADHRPIYAHARKREGAVFWRNFQPTPVKLSLANCMESRTYLEVSVVPWPHIPETGCQWGLGVQHTKSNRPPFRTPWRNVTWTTSRADHSQESGSMSKGWRQQHLCQHNPQPQKSFKLKSAVNVVEPTTQSRNRSCSRNWGWPGEMSVWRPERNTPYHLIGVWEVAGEENKESEKDFLLYLMNCFSWDYYGPELNDFGNAFGSKKVYVTRLCMVVAVYFEVAWARGRSGSFQ